MRSTGTILIPAAGESRRFTEKGFAGHKAALTLEFRKERKSMLRHIVDQMPTDRRIVVVCQTRHADQLIEASEGAEQKIELCLLDYSTQGQSDTIFQGLEVVDLDAPVVIQNCDSWIHTDMWGWACSMSHIAAIVLHRDRRPESAPPIYSYVNNPHFPSAWAEKRRISDYAQTGLWSFPTARGLRDILSTQLQDRAPGETYLSGALPHYPSRFAGRLATSGEYADLGTPEMIFESGAKICS